MADFNINAPVAPANLPVEGAQQKVKVAKARRNVMPQVAQEHGQGGRKKASEIIQQYTMQQTGSQERVNQTMAMLNQLIQRKLSRLIQFGNTVFWATQAGRGTIDVHIFSEDSPKLMARQIQKFYQWCKAHGFTRVTSTLTDSQQIGVVKLAGIPYTLKPTQVNDGQKMVPAQIMTVEVR